MSCKDCKFWDTHGETRESALWGTCLAPCEDLPDDEEIAPTKPDSGCDLFEAK